MKKASVGVLLLVVAAVALYGVLASAGTATVDVAGAAGTKFTGTATIDGKKRDLSGVVPARFALEGRVISFEMELPDADVKVVLDVPGQGSGTVAAGSPAPTHVRGDVQFGAWSRSYHIGAGNGLLAEFRR